MIGRVHVTLKKGVLDPQGKTIHRALETMGYQGIAEVRQGKYFEITLDDSLSRRAATELLERIARDLLANPVIEDYTVEVE